MSDSATLRAMVSRAIKDAGDKCYGNDMAVQDACDVLADAAIAVCQSSWANEKAELARQVSAKDVHIGELCQALKSADRLAREDAARIADKEADEYIAGSKPETWTFAKSQRAAFEMRQIGEAIKLVAAAIRASITTDEG